MPRSLFSILLLAVLFFGLLSAQEEETTVRTIEEEQQLEWSGNLDLKYTLMHMDQRSAQYQIQFWKLPPASSFLSQYEHTLHNPLPVNISAPTTHSRAYDDRMRE